MVELVRLRVVYGRPQAVWVEQITRHEPDTVPQMLGRPQ